MIYASLGKHNGAVVRRVTHRKKVLGSNPRAGLSVWLLSRYSGFLPQSKTHVVWLTGVNLIVSESLLAIDWIDIRIYPNLALMTAGMGPSLPRN